VACARPLLFAHAPKPKENATAVKRRSKDFIDNSPSRLRGRVVVRRLAKPSRGRDSGC
jgi:hypothetical protein